MCLKFTQIQTIQDVDEFDSLYEQIFRNVALHHLLTNGSSAVNGCRQKWEFKQLIKHHNNPQDSSPLINVLWTGKLCKEVPGWNDPMTAVVPRVKGFACYGLSFSRHNKNIKMEHFFLYILSRYFIWLHKWKGFNDICASLKYENEWLIILISSF